VGVHQPGCTRQNHCFLPFLVRFSLCNSWSRSIRQARGNPAAPFDCSIHGRRPAQTKARAQESSSPNWVTVPTWSTVPRECTVLEIHPPLNIGGFSQARQPNPRESDTSKQIELRGSGVPSNSTACEIRDDGAHNQLTTKGLSSPITFLSDRHKRLRPVCERDQNGQLFATDPRCVFLQVRSHGSDYLSNSLP
jgi:hypothetical protein